MDFKKIFLKDACPTSIGGQAIMEGIMMRGPVRTATAIRLSSGKIYLKTEPTPKKTKAADIPFIRGVVNFISSLILGTKILMFSADILEKDMPESFEKDKFDIWIEKKFGKEKAWDILLTFSVVLAIIIGVGLFILFPTVIVGWVGKNITSTIGLNLIEGGVRIIMFLLYVLLISLEKDVRRVFEFHGAEHKTIHCYENGLELTPENCQSFYTLHPRCGTSFIMFVLIISIIVHAFLGWPNMWLRILTRLLVLPIIAGISYELLKWAGSCDNTFIKILSLPGIYLQRLTTREPDFKELEVAIVALKAVLPNENEDEVPFFEGTVDEKGNICES